MRKLLIIAFCFAFASNLGQSNQLLRRQATEASYAKDWYAAEQYYKRLYDRDSTDLAVAYGYAWVTYQGMNVDVSIRLCRRIARIDNGDKYPLVFYFLGQLYKYKEKYKDARGWFVKFNKQVPKRERYEYYHKKCRLEEDACEWAIEQTANDSSRLKIDHLEALINSRLSEYAATENDSVLWFSSMRPEKKADDIQDPDPMSRIYRSEIRRGRAQRVRALDTAFNANKTHNANVVISSDGKQMFFSRCTRGANGDYLCQLYRSEALNKRWTVPSKVEAPFNNAGNSVTQPAFGKVNGNNVLFFSSNVAGGEGGMDIWYVPLLEDGAFGEPVNAGKSVNTPDDEITPWYDFRRNRLYFSSTWFKGFGGFDIFYSRQKDGQFETPVNAGHPINSSLNDTYYSISNTGTHVYISSNRKGTLFDNNKVNCCNDIFRFDADTTHPAPPPPPPKVDSVVVKKDEMRQLVPLTLYFNNDQPDPRTTNTVTTRNYSDCFKEYDKMKKSYVREYSRGLKGTDADVAENQIRNFFVDSLESGFDNLNRFATLLKDVLQNGEKVKITLKGYCSPLASNDYNIKLAQRRISSLRNYFNELDNGYFKKYIDNTAPGEGRIEFEEVKVGELEVSKASDDFADIRNSIYSPTAALERKIQILAVSFGK